MENSLSLRDAKMMSSIIKLVKAQIERESNSIKDYIDEQLELTVIETPQPGLNGRGIVNASLLDENLILTYTDGFKENVGSVRGPRGYVGEPGPKGDTPSLDAIWEQIANLEKKISFTINTKSEEPTKPLIHFDESKLLLKECDNLQEISSDLLVGDTLYVNKENNRVGVNTQNPDYDFQVEGSFAATTKSFVINHPTKDGMKLRYGSLEGPENGVYVRGRVTTHVIRLPDYWKGLVDENSITVNLTPIGKSKLPSIDKIEDNKIFLTKSFFDDTYFIDCFFIIYAERKDVAKFEVEF